MVERFAPSSSLKVGAVKTTVITFHAKKTTVIKKNYRD